MREDEFLKEKQNIRQKMLKYSRAISQGRPLDDEFRSDTESDIILKRRFKKRQNLHYEDFEEHFIEKKSNIYLKEDLINVKLDEEKQPLSFRVFNYLKNKKKSVKNLSEKQNKKKEKPILKAEVKLQIPKDTSHKSKENLKEEKISHLAKNNHFISNNIKSKKEPKNNTSKPQTISTQKKIEKKIKPQKEPSDENTQKAKNTLLDGYIEATTEDRNLNYHHLLFSALLISFSLFLFAPQIYIRNQIYYLSKEIATLKTEENILIEENKELKRSLENMRFQNQILDYLE